MVTGTAPPLISAKDIAAATEPRCNGWVNDTLMAGVVFTPYTVLSKALLLIWMESLMNLR